MEIIKFNKQDFLTANQLAKQLGENKDFIEKNMKTLYYFGIRITVNNHKAPLITRHAGPRYKIHPCGIEYFKEYIQNKR